MNKWSRNIPCSYQAWGGDWIRFERLLFGPNIYRGIRVFGFKIWFCNVREREAKHDAH